MAEGHIPELISREQIEQKITELAKDIYAEYQADDVIILTVLEGAQTFAKELFTELKQYGMAVIPDAIKVQSYSGTHSSGAMRLVQDLSRDVKDQDVLIVEDIIDTGSTISFVKEHLERKGAASVKVCSLLDKPEGREQEIEIHFLGFTVPNKFVVGYGLDHNGQHRELPYVGYIN